MNKLVTVLTLVSAALALPLTSYDECEKAYNACIAAEEVACSCTLTACVGEDSARIREYCSSATASLAQPTKTEIPSASKNDTVPVETFTPIPGIPGGCNPAHLGSCSPPYHTGLPPTFTPIPIVPGGCSPAHPELCVSAHITYNVTSAATHPSFPVPTNGVQPVPGIYPGPMPIVGKTWAIQNLTRYCGEDDDRCDYNFIVETDGKTERCTIIRMPGSNAATESWTNEPCTDGSNLRISWGYVTEPAPAFAVITAVRDKELAWFGVSDVNGQQVTSSNPYGSGDYGTLGPEQVYTY